MQAASIDVQDFLVVPVGARTFAEAIEWASRVRAATAAVLRERGPTSRSSQTRAASRRRSPRTARRWTCCWRGSSGVASSQAAEVAIAVDIAATQLLVDGKYVLASENRSLRADELVDEIVAWVDDYPIVSIEDPLGEDDEEGWRLATAQLAQGIQLLGDDLFVTSPSRLKAGISEGIANAVLVKPNQIGTLSDARQVVAIAQDAGYATVSRPARARPRTAGLLIWRSAGEQGSSRWARQHAPSAPRNGTASCESSPRSPTRPLPAGAHFTTDTRAPRQQYGSRRNRTSTGL